MKKYFKVLLPGAKVHIPNQGFNRLGYRTIDLSDVPYDALSLYTSGFPHLALLPEAAEKLKDFSEEGLKKLIEQKKKEYPDDVPILEEALALKSKSVKKVKTNELQGKL